MEYFNTHWEQEYLDQGIQTLKKWYIVLWFYHYIVEILTFLTV